MSTHQNLIDIYEKIYAYSDTLPKGEVQDGYDEALYLFMLELKKLDGINYHIENKRLREQCEDLKRVRELLLSSRQQVKLLRSENTKLKAQIGKEKIRYIKY